MSYIYMAGFMKTVSIPCTKSPTWTLVERLTPSDKNIRKEQQKEEKRVEGKNTDIFQIYSNM